ncbi:MarR family winged helix-turn-helix transcriptional regulator [Pallidibacillus pasinlerensis]|uniref:MarR family transcriptional regulator n=1 Tax=Pallidibacillus pasinlerensis TaxID=2703818 RepID=A0ABX0A3X0_9BACI|nr:MarR family transcriptional regulator [Pallidibacillus pasinlerensis]NCU18136.1 MarR family transcriptional regulator [Pallidibacillus pasinlerensis]
MEQRRIYELIDKYIELTHEVWKNSENLIREEISEDLTNDQHYILRYIYKNGKATTTGLAEAFSVQKSAITAIVNRLVDKNLIMRTYDEADRRYIFLTLTEEGKKQFEKTEKKIFNLVKSFIIKFDREEIENFIKTYEKLASIIREIR